MAFSHNPNAPDKRRVEPYAIIYIPFRDSPIALCARRVEPYAIICIPFRDNPNAPDKRRVEPYAIIYIPFSHALDFHHEYARSASGISLKGIQIMSFGNHSPAIHIENSPRWFCDLCHLAMLFMSFSMSIYGI